MLFDGKRQRTLTKVVAIIAIVAFAGFGLVAGGLAVSGGCGTSDPLQQSIDDASARVTAEKADLAAAQKAATASPNSAAAKADLEQATTDLATAQSTLAQARLATDRNDPAALADALAATETAPGNADAVLSLVTIATTQGNPAAALPAVAAYTRLNPEDAEMYSYWGQLAEQAGQRTQAILAYQRFLELAPDDPVAPDIRNRLSELTEQTATTG